MARIPDVQDLGPRAIPGARAPIADISIPAGGAQIQTGRSLRNLAGQLDEQADAFNLAKAESMVLQGAIKAENEVQQGDWHTWEEAYNARMKSVLDEAGGLIRSPRARELFRMNAETSTLRGAIGLRNAMQGRENDEGRATLDELISGNLDSAMEVDDARADALLSNINASIDAAAGKGYITREAAGAMKRDAAETYAVRRVSMITDPASRLAVVSGAGGKLQPDAEAAIQMYGGEDADILTTMALIESGGNPQAVNPTSGASGLFQFMPATARDYGLVDSKNSVESTKAARALLQNNRRALSAKLGRPAQDWELYLAHQQGAGGAGALLAEPGRNAVDVLTSVYGGDRKLATAVITQNGGSPSMTAGSFANMWRQKYAAKGGEAGQASVYAKYIPLDKRVSIAADAMRQLESERNQRETDYAAGFSDYISALTSGAEIPAGIDIQYSDTMIAANVSDPEKQSLMQEVRDDAVRQAGYMSDIQGADPETLATIAAAASAAVTVSDETDLALAADRTRANENLRAAIKADMQKRQDDPAGYVMSYNNPASQARDNAAYAEATIAEQTRLGILQPRVLTNQMAGQMVTQIMQVPADQRGATVAEMEKTWGSSWGRVLGELKANKLDPVTYHAALVADDPVLSERIASLATTPIKTLEQGLERTETSDLRTSVETELQSFRAVFEAGDPSGTATNTFNELQDVAYGLALQEFRKTGNARQAMQFATDRLVNERYDVLDGNNFSAYVPREFDSRLVEDGARALLEDETLLAKIIPFGGDEDEEYFIRRSRAETAAKNGTWFTNATGDGLQLRVDVQGRYLPIVTEDGYIEMKFDALQKLGEKQTYREPAGYLPFQ